MKKRDLWIGLGMIAAGILCLLAALSWATPLGGLFFGLLRGVHRTWHRAGL